MKEIYQKLNFYLNEICKYLEIQNSFLLENIGSISKLNDTFLKYINHYPLDTKTIQNNLTYEDVFLLAREVIEHIDKGYLESFDNLISSGELDFNYKKIDENSVCISIYKNNLVKQIININRQFNYNDVIALVHEFIHYTNGVKESKNRYYLTEFLSIYFEFYAVDYLLEKGINREEIDHLFRIKDLKEHSHIFFKYEIVLFAFVNFKNLNDNTVSLLQQYLCNIKKEIFEKECTILYKKLCIAEERHQEEINESPEMLGCILSEAFVVYNYRYILSTFLAIYAYKYSDFNDIVDLNNHISEHDSKTIYDICLSINIDLRDKNFPNKLFIAMNEYINNKQIASTKSIES